MSKHSFNIARGARKQQPEGDASLGLTEAFAPIGAGGAPEQRGAAPRLFAREEPGAHDGGPADATADTETTAPAPRTPRRAGKGTAEPKQD